MLHVYNLPHLQFLGSFQKIGNGPDEVILPSAFTQWFNKDGQIQLVMRSYQKFTGLLNISKSLIENKAIYDNKYTYNAPKGKNSFQQSSVSYLLGDSIFLINRSIIMRPQDNQNDFLKFTITKTTASCAVSTPPISPRSCQNITEEIKLSKKILQSAMIARRWSLHTDSSI